MSFNFSQTRELLYFCSTGPWEGDMAILFLEHPHSTYDSYVKIQENKSQKVFLK